MASTEPWLLENGNLRCLTMEMKQGHGHSRTAHNRSSSSLRRKSDLTLVSKVRKVFLRKFLVNLQEVLLGSKLSILFLAIPFAVAAECTKFGRPWVFALSLLGLTPLAERVSFLTKQIAFYTGPTVGGLLNATCGNATELIISIFALIRQEVDVVKYSLLGSILSNLLLVLGTSLFCGGIANLRNEQKFDRLCSHRELFEASVDEEEDSRVVSDESAVIGFWSAFVWLVLMTGVMALLSEYVVGTIEAASDSWGLSVGFISVILLPIVGNAAEHAGAVIFAFKNKLQDISLGVALGSATQIATFVIPLSIIVAWIIGINMNLDFNLFETSCLALSIIVTTFALQDGTSHYLKGVVLLLCYLVIGAGLFIFGTPNDHADSETKISYHLSSNEKILKDLVP
ncbi:vacuolar cation/proton exchanger 1b-like isoform X6 [Olea europaea var. sylvestris]|uniref:vacuolar cation/proton exchanger 1b-like isoform X6 n=1 Tax=Olea europaea var. sylvestris TaxID=158386 RepID=UPI000C1D540A|nr:vacuolar cation/proton exchanger 1b-like isoform X6 [Olea europaea var. sylvestris]